MKLTIEEYIKRKRAGEIDHGIAHTFGITDRALVYWKQKNGLTNKQFYRPITQEEYKALRQKGYLNREIAEIKGIGETSLYRYKLLWEIS